MSESVMIRDMEKLLKKIQKQEAYKNLLNEIKKGESVKIVNRNNNNSSNSNNNRA